jgi:hypothetical protein
LDFSRRPRIVWLRLRIVCLRLRIVWLRLRIVWLCPRACQRHQTLLFRVGGVGVVGGIGTKPSP